MHAMTISSIRINGGRLCLDFVNTRTYAASPREFLAAYADLVTWGQREALIGAGEVRRLLIMARDAPEAAAAALRTARDLRLSLRSLLEPGVPVAALAAGLDGLNAAASRTRPHLAIAAGGGLRYVSAATLDDWLLGPVAISAMDLATSPARAQVHVCPGEDCHWLFLDQSRNATRRWCSMASCGGKAKARTHYDTHRRGPVPPAGRWRAGGP